MLEKLEAIKLRYEDIQAKMNEPSVMSDMKNYIQLNKDYKELQPIMEAYEIFNIVEIEPCRSITNLRLQNQCTHHY